MLPLLQLSFHSFKCYSLYGTAASQSGGVSASSEPDQSGFLYAPPDHFLWSASRTPELDHSLANVFVQANINQFGEMAVAGCGAYMKIQGFGFLPITCFALALTTFISQNLGAKEYDRAKRALYSV